MKLVFGLAMLTIAFVFTTLRAIFDYEVLPDLTPDQLMAGEGRAKGSVEIGGTDE